MTKQYDKKCHFSKLKISPFGRNDSALFMLSMLHNAFVIPNPVPNGCEGAGEESKWIASRDLR